MRILTIDDDQTCVLALSTKLASYGECHVVNSGEEGIVKFVQALRQERPFGLICLDIHMPGLDGYVTLTCLRAVEKGFELFGRERTKVMMVSCDGDKKNIMKAFQNECDAYLEKPIAENDFILQMKLLGIHTIK